MTLTSVHEEAPSFCDAASVVSEGLPGGVAETGALETAIEDFLDVIDLLFETVAV